MAALQCHMAESRNPHAALAEKTCPACGRRFAWRKKWAQDWPNVRYCSRACRRDKPDAEDRALERAILDLLHERPTGGTICPSEAARRVDPQRWRRLMERSRRAGRRLADAGTVRFLQKGRPVDPTVAKGPVRLQLKSGD